ncbi:mycofactocin-coupled SDR family oxidoreductase [Rhodococcoides navarretei]|uniref:Mycofactocin-coupled SDR family oxidoreductase n=1 Tax=Rhodococcus navarretei TaxID=3128981 RepID=A0ABU9D0I3_9NOCA
MGQFDGKVAFITGAARGQGRSHAVRLAEEGADIIAVDICKPIDSVTPFYSLAEPSDLDETVSLIEGMGRRIVARQADVRDLAGLQAAFAAGIAELGRVDIVLANAGIFISHDAANVPEESWRDVIDINLTGVFFTAQVAIPQLVEQGDGGVILLTSSTAGMQGYANAPHYTASKHGVVGLMKSLAQELGKHGIRVNSIHPTGVDTPMIQNERTWGLFSPGDPNPNREKAAETMKVSNLLPVPWIDPREVSNLVAWLVSDQARNVTASQYSIDAGAVNKS